MGTCGVQKKSSPCISSVSRGGCPGKNPIKKAYNTGRMDACEALQYAYWAGYSSVMSQGFPGSGRRLNGSNNFFPMMQNPRTTQQPSMDDSMLDLDLFSDLGLGDDSLSSLSLFDDDVDF